MFFQKKKDKKEPIPDFSEVHVTLKPIMGIPPGYYLTFLYGLILAFVLYLVLFLPGIRRGGTKLTVTSNPAGAAVWVDDAYQGNTPCRIFVSKGKHVVTVKKSYCRPYSEEKLFRGRLFASLFFPRKDELSVDIPVEDPIGLLDGSLSDFMEWGMLRNFADNTALPPVLSEAVAMTASSSNPAVESKIREVILNAAFFSDSPMELGEILRALFLSRRKGEILTSVTVKRVLAEAASFYREYPSFPFWLSQSLSRVDREMGLDAVDLQKNNGYRAFQKSYIENLENLTIDTADGPERQTVNVMSVAFHPVQGGSFLGGKSLRTGRDRIDSEYPYPARVEDYYIGDTEVTNRQFSLFLNENPGWSADNMNNLIQNAYVSDEYLQHWKDGKYPQGEDNHPVVNVSYFSAAAFCEWLTAKLPPALSGFSVRLPREEEWEWPVRSGLTENSNGVFGRTGTAAPSNPEGIVHMMGNVWEWSEDPALPLKNLLIPSAFTYGLVSVIEKSAERVVKGGSWANEEIDVSVHTRGSQPPDWCTPYLGFRAVIARR